MEVQGTSLKARVTQSPQVTTVIKVLLSKNSFKDVTPTINSSRTHKIYFGISREVVSYFYYSQFIDFIDSLSAFSMQFSDNLEMISSMHEKIPQFSFSMLNSTTASRCGEFAVYLRYNRSISRVSPARAMNLLAHLLKFVYEAIPC